MFKTWTIWDSQKKISINFSSGACNGETHIYQCRTRKSPVLRKIEGFFTIDGIGTKSQKCREYTYKVVFDQNRNEYRRELELVE